MENENNEEQSNLNNPKLEYDKIKVYSERAPYSQTSKKSEVFGKHNQEVIEHTVSKLVELYDQKIVEGDKQSATFYESAIKKIGTQVDHLAGLKDEWMMMRGGGMRGKNTVSNITDPRWPDEFFTENGTISFTPNFDIMCGVPSLPNGTKMINDIPLDWESKGDGEGRYMSAIKDLVDAGERGDKAPPFNVDYFVSNLLDEYWPQALSDKWGGVYALHNILPEMIEENNNTAEGLNLSIEAFNPQVDNRLHRYYADRLKKAFNPNYQTPKEVKRAKQILANLQRPGSTSDQYSQQTRKAVKTAKKEGKI